MSLMRVKSASCRPTANLSTLEHQHTTTRCAQNAPITQSSARQTHLDVRRSARLDWLLDVAAVAAIAVVATAIEWLIAKRCRRRRLASPRRRRFYVCRPPVRQLARLLTPPPVRSLAPSSRLLVRLTMPPPARPPRRPPRARQLAVSKSSASFVVVFEHRRRHRVVERRRRQPRLFNFQFARFPPPPPRLLLARAPSMSPPPSPPLSQRHEIMRVGSFALSSSSLLLLRLSFSGSSLSLANDCSRHRCNETRRHASNRRKLVDLSVGRLQRKKQVVKAISRDDDDTMMMIMSPLVFNFLLTRNVCAKRELLLPELHNQSSLKIQVSIV